MNDMTMQPNSHTALGSESIVLRSTAALHDVHAYALGELEKLEADIVRLKHAIELQKNRSQQEITVYVELVDDALRAAQSISEAVARIAATVEQV